MLYTPRVGKWGNYESNHNTQNIITPKLWKCPLGVNDVDATLIQRLMPSSYRLIVVNTQNILSGKTSQVYESYIELISALHVHISFWMDW